MFVKFQVWLSILSQETSPLSTEKVPKEINTNKNANMPSEINREL